jgi:Ca2+-binding EF-hand superfamily protein
MNRKTLLFVTVLTALGAGSAVAATQASDAQKPARASLDANNDGAIDKAEAAGHARLAEHFDRLDRNADGKLTPDERPQQRGRHGGKGGWSGSHAFQKLDADGDGKVSRAEAAAEPRFAERFDRLDANRDGVVDRTDRELQGKQRRDEWFAKADADKDGKLTRAEIDRSDAQRRVEFQQRAEARMAERISALDTNKDGRVSREEAKGSERLASRFDSLDADRDGVLTKDELAARRGQR